MADIYLVGGDADTPESLDAQDNLLGIFQSDIILRSAIITGIADLRAHPELLDYVFGSLPNDDLTNLEYGRKQVDEAKKWFLNTDIPVFFNTRLDEAKYPCITIALLESNEDANTFSDTHYKTYQELDGATPNVWSILAGPFVPTSYDYVTGVMTIPTSISDMLVFSTEMVLVSANGKSYAIEDASDTTITLPAGSLGNFAGSTLRIKRPPQLVSLESVIFKETYAIGCHVQSHSVNLMWLHSILTFVLLRYKQSLLEARGFERSVISSSDFLRDEQTFNELTYVRFIKLTGYVRNYWPKNISDKLTSVTTDISVVGAPVLTDASNLFVGTMGATSTDLTVFWGYAPDGTHNSAFITGLSSHQQQAAYSSSTYRFTVPPVSPQNYLWVALPDIWNGVASFKDQNGDSFPMTRTDASIAVSGYPTGYSLWRSDNVISGYAFTLEARS